jgi:MerR family transcriptional regulator, light-induced transcriptional regulator
MNKFYEEFFNYLEAENKQRAVKFAIGILDSGEIDIVSLYEQVLAPALYNMTCNTGDGKTCIWKEHEKTSIVRTIIECCYPHIIKELEDQAIKSKSGNVLVLCPSEEYHEIGARMVADFFTLCGYKAIYIGSNTPRADLISSLDYLKPRYIAISVTDYYNLVTAAKTIKELRESNYKEYEIIVGGQAFQKNPEVYKKIGADRRIDTYKEVEMLCKEEKS